MFKVKKLHENAKAPTKNVGDAGYDLYSVGPVNVGPGHRATIDTGIAISIPEGCVALIWPRSGLSVKNGIDVLAGVVDQIYRGEVKVCLFNTGTDTFSLPAGSRIAQMLIQKYEELEVVEVDELDETTRGQNGIGSSGN